MYKHILVPLPEGMSTELADHGAGLAHAVGAKLTLLHVIHSHSRDEAAYRTKRIESELAAAAGRAAALGVEVDTMVRVGEPHDEIVAAARQVGADLIVMATHGHAEVRHLLVGSVTEAVIRDVDIPVLLLKPGS